MVIFWVIKSTTGTKYSLVEGGTAGIAMRFVNGRDTHIFWEIESATGNKFHLLERCVRGIEIRFANGKDMGIEKKKIHYGG